MESLARGFVLVRYCWTMVDLAPSDSRPRRTWGVSEQKIVGARQGWRCAHCNELLPSSYELDHVKPLWNGGPNVLENAEALCNDCHGKKTQREAIERRDRYRERLLKAVQAAGAEAPDEPPPPPRKRHKFTEKERWVERERFLTDNPFLQYAYVRHGVIKM